MNLAKKGTVLLAALSVFAMTSCGCSNNNSTDNSISYDQAKKWVSEHYKGGEDKDYSKYKKSWDYSKNDGKGKKTPSNWTIPEQLPFGDKDINFFAQQALSNSSMFDIKGDVTKSTGSEEADSPFPYDEGVFEINLGKNDNTFDLFWLEVPSAKFYVENNKLKVVDTHPIGEDATFDLGKGELSLHFMEIDTVYYDTNGYAYKHETKYEYDHFATHLHYEEINEVVDLGVVNMLITIEPLAQ